MDIVSLQEAKKARKQLGNIDTLITDAKDNVVNALNEVCLNVNKGTEPTVYNYDFPNVDTNQIVEMDLPFTGSCFIRGIKVTGDAFTGDFYLKFYTKNPSDGGSYVYYSGKATNVLWDIMDIPYTDESKLQKIHMILDNRGALTHFKLQIYVLKGQ